MDNYAYQQDDNGKPSTISYPTLPRQSNDYLVEVNARSKFLKNPKFYKKLTVILTVLALLLLIAVIVLAVLYCTTYYDNQLCTSEECLRSAANLHLSIDFSVDPCDDFYDYTCGRWSQEHPNHGWFPSFSAFQTISEKLLIDIEDFLTSDDQEDEPLPVKQTRNFYQSCMDSDSRNDLGLSVIYKYLHELDLPSIPSLFTKTEQEIDDFQFDWLKSEAAIKNKLSMDLFMGFTVDANLYNRSQNVIYAGVPTLPCPLPSPAKKHFKNKREDGIDYVELRKATNARIIKFVLTTFVKNITSEEPKDDILQEATDILLNITFHIDELIGNYTEISDEFYPRNIKDYQTKLNSLLTDNIKKDYPQILEKYSSYMFEGTNVTIDFDKDLFYLAPTDEEYLPKILGYVMTTSDIYLELYMWWVTVFAMILNTSSDVVEYIVKQTAPFYSGMTVLRSRSLDCSLLVNTFMGMAVSYGLADRTFSNKTKPKVEQMLCDIKDAFVEHVNSLSWMDKKTKRATLEKSKEMISFIGYPEWLFENGSLDIYYRGIVLNNDTYLENMMSFVKIFVPSRLADLRTINERTWSADPTDVNAYNSFPDNSINVPMAILAFPVYNLGLEVLNYGAIGSILGHELTHGFDNTGRKYDKFGNHKKWWTNDTIATFEGKTECFVKQYDNFTIPGVENHVQGRKTLGENLADNGGLGHAYKAYHNYLKKQIFSDPKLPGFEDFTNDQLFFIAFGSIWCQSISLGELEDDMETDVHSPNKIRVLGSLQNSKEFANAFKCPVGSKMNPDRNKCVVW